MMNEEIKAEMTKVLEAQDKANAEYRKYLEESMAEKAKVLQALHAIRLPNVEVPEINYNSLRWYTNIKVSDVRMFPVLQKILGCKFEHYGKTPIGDGRKKTIRVSMVIAGNDKLRYELCFQYERKLTDADKCKVETVTEKRVRVVCTR